MNVTDGGALSRSIAIDNTLLDDPKRHQILYPDQLCETDISGGDVRAEASPINSYSYPPDSYAGMGKFPRGKLIIFNIENFQSDNEYYLSRRDGTVKDREALTELFLHLGFIVEVFNDVTKKELMQVLKRLSRDSFQSLGALFVAFLTHGLEKQLYMTNGMVPIRTITDYLKGSNLAGKPKVLLIQACQGSKYMGSTLEVDGPQELKRETISFPAESDFLYAYSTVRGFFSWRNSSNGSWFIQALCKVFRKHAHTMDVVRMLTRVNALVTKHVSDTGERESSGKRQVTSTVSQLRKDLYILPPSPPLHC